MFLCTYTFMISEMVAIKLLRQTNNAMESVGESPADSN
jgi:hypothetical protein